MCTSKYKLVSTAYKNNTEWNHVSVKANRSNTPDTSRCSFKHVTNAKYTHDFFIVISRLHQIQISCSEPWTKNNYNWYLFFYGLHRLVCAFFYLFFHHQPVEPLKFDFQFLYKWEECCCCCFCCCCALSIFVWFNVLSNVVSIDLQKSQVPKKEFATEPRHNKSAWKDSMFKQECRHSILI